MASDESLAPARSGLDPVSAAARASPGTAVRTGFPASVETRSSWVVAFTALGILAVSYGAPLVSVVALKPIAADLGGERSVPALANSLAWFGTAVGGIVMGRIAERVGVRWTVAFGALMIGLGLYVSTLGGAWPLWIGHGLFIGLIGNAGLNAPLYVYVSRWFDRRCGTALALISSGQYLAGAIWPPLFERAVAAFGWSRTMLLVGAVLVAVIVPAAFVLRPPPRAQALGPAAGTSRSGGRVLGWPPNVVLAILSVASFFCCIPMAMPSTHLIAFCGDLGIAPARGAVMLSVLLATAFVSRQIWGWLSDRIGGLRTVLVGSASMAAAMLAFLLTQNEAGLFAVAAAFGLGYSGIIPAYVLAVRQLFPASEASWRVPTLLLCSGSGMAAGGWLAGLLYDHYGFYAPAFGTGIAFNLANFVLVGLLVSRRRHAGHGLPALAA